MYLTYSLLAVLLAVGVTAGSPGDCPSLRQSLKLPAKMKTRGKPPRARWEQVDKVLSEAARQMQDNSCLFTFSELFGTNRKELLFPLTNTVLRTTEQGALEGLQVFTSEGEALGRFAGRVRYERSGGLYARQSYSLYYFQFRDSAGDLHSSGNDLLLDRFNVKWTQIKDRVAMQGAETEP